MLKKKLICGLDIGSFKVCLTCGIVEPSGAIEILGSQIVPSEGMEAGRIVDGKRLSACIREALRRMRKVYGIKVHRVYTSIDSPDVSCKLYQENLPFNQNVVPKTRRAQIKKLISSVVSTSVPENRRIIQLNSACVRDASTGVSKLNITIVSAAISTVERMIQCIKEARLILQDIIPSGVAQAYGIYNHIDGETARNFVLLDIGAKLTKINFFEQLMLKEIVTLPEGAHSVTAAIAARFGLSFDCAEQLKVKYGRADAEVSPINQRMLIKDKLTNRIIQSRQFYEVITAQTDQLLSRVKKILSDLNYGNEQMGEIIVTGGGAILEGFLERAEKVLGQPAKMGFLSAVKDSLIQAQSARYASSVGLMRFAAKNRDSRRLFAGNKFSSLRHLFKQAQQLYHEYF